MVAYSWNTWAWGQRRGAPSSAPPAPPAAPPIVEDIDWAVFVNAAWESSPPSALAAQAQNTGISDGGPLLSLTDWSPNARHLSRADTNGASFSESGLAGGPGINFASSATANKGYAPLTPILLTDNAVTTFVLASKDLGSGSDGYFFSIARAPFSNGPVCQRNGTDTLRVYTDTFAANGITDQWFYSDLEMRPRLYFVEVDRTTATTTIRTWQNGILKSETTSGARAGGAPSLPHIFAALNGASPLIDEIVAFAGFVDGALTQEQRDTIAAYFAETTGEPAWYTGWSYTQVEPWLKTLVNARWEANPALAPAAWQARAQNTGVADASTVNGVTDWGTGNHLVSATAPQRFVYLSAGLNGEPTFSLDGVDDGVVSGSAVNVSPLGSMVIVAAPAAALSVIAEHGPNAASSPNGQHILSVVPASSDFVAQSRRTNPPLFVRRNRGGYADGTPHVLAFDSNPDVQGVSWRVDQANATTSVSSTAGTMTGDYSDFVYLGCRIGAAFPTSGELSFFAFLDGNKAASRVVEYQAALDYGI